MDVLIDTEWSPLRRFLGNRDGTFALNVPKRIKIIQKRTGPMCIIGLCLIQCWQRFATCVPLTNSALGAAADPAAADLAVVDLAVVDS